MLPQKLYRQQFRARHAGASVGPILMLGLTVECTESTGSEVVHRMSRKNSSAIILSTICFTMFLEP